MTTRTDQTTEHYLKGVLADLRALIASAQADAQHALDNGALDTAWDDEVRAMMLTNALRMLEDCKRYAHWRKR